MKTFIETMTTEIKTIDEYFEKEKLLVTELADKYVVGATLKGSYGQGTVKSVDGDIFENIILNVLFENAGLKRFSLCYILLNPSFVAFENDDVIDNSKTAYTAHLELVTQYKKLKFQALQERIVAEKQAEADRKAEQKYNQQKDASIKAFDKFANQASYADTTEEFYFALGWLAAHAGTVSAQMPNYLEDAFNKHFGPQDACRIIDSKKKTSSGNSMQYTFSFAMSLRKVTTVPEILKPHMSATGKSVASTSFIWILIDSYGFQFGKKQDVNEIKKHVPTEFMQAFEDGRKA